LAEIDVCLNDPFNFTIAFFPDEVKHDAGLHPVAETEAEHDVVATTGCGAIRKTSCC
jgi:hypothetical protein